MIKQLKELISMIRSPEDICLICEMQYSTKKGSHWVPASIIAPCVGNRNYEESFDLNFNLGDIDTYFGQSNIKNNTHGLQFEKKLNHYVHDYIFCPDCESLLGDLEGSVAPFLMTEIRNNTASYNEKTNPFGIKFREPKKVGIDRFLAFFCSVVLRYDISFRISHGKSIVPEHEAELMRQVVEELIYTDEISASREASKEFRFQVITKAEFKDDDPTFILTSNVWDCPNILYMCQFIILWFSTDDKGKVKASPFADIVNMVPYDPNIIIIEDAIWDMMIDNIKMFKDDFLLKIGERLTKEIGGEVVDNIKLFQKEVAKIEKEDVDKVDLNYTKRAIDLIITKGKK